jgi:Uma2 family endonuclease
MALGTEATIEELRTVHGKAELVEGKIVTMSPMGGRPGRAAFAVCCSLRDSELTHGGYAYPDNVGFVVDLPNRQSFSPDAAFRVKSPRMDFVQGTPDFAVEVRSECDYGSAADRAAVAKRVDYFAAGTKVVWDVDLLGDEVVRVYRAGNPDQPTAYRRGQTAEAEPAVPGWTFAVDELFQ